MLMKKETINNWLYEHSWVMLGTLVGMVAFLVGLQFQVNQNTNTVYAMQQQIDRYPSEQYFDLRFTNLEKSVDEIKVELKAK